jgi:uncharacterized OB-fold protein
MIDKPCPVPTRETRPFWTACAEGRLAYQRCGRCGKAMFPPGDVCRTCHARLLEWQAASGFGTVHSFTIVHRAPTKAFADDVPYVLALIDLEEGFRMMANVVRCDPGAVCIGAPVRVVFEQRGESRQLPQFELE